jgi:CHAT domain-containing protein
VAGNTAAALGRHRQALDYLKRSAELDVDPAGVARTQVLVAAQLRALGDLRGAEAALAPALTSSNMLARAEALSERGALRLARRDHPGAADDLRAADVLFAELGLDFSRIDSNTGLSQALLALDDTAGAIAAADTAIGIVGRIRVNSANPEWRARFLSARYLPFEMRIAAEFAARAEHAETPAWNSFRIAEDVRARSLAELLDSGRDRDAAADSSRLDALRAQLTAQQMRMETRTARLDTDEAGTLALRRAIVETRARIDSERLRRQSLAANTQALPGALAEVQAALPADTAVLAYFVGDGASHAWLLTRDGLKHARLGGREAMQRAADTLTDALRRSAPGARPPAELASHLFGSLLNGVSQSRLLIVPDGPLNSLPFAAVRLADKRGDELLVERFVIGYAPSLALAMRERAARPAAAQRIAVVSDPVYAADDRRLASSDGSGQLRGARLESRYRLTRLPYSALEARAVTRALGDDVLQISGFDATPRKVLELASTQLKILHFATHAVARADSPEQSALFLSEFRADGSRLDDSQLTVGDIARSGLNANVVVLSACETGEGSRLRGEGVLGLTYGFLANGSGSVVAALWPIEDAGTAKFMSEFYGAYRTSAKPADALRAAQLRTRQSARAAVWSSFVVRANGFP